VASLGAKLTDSPIHNFPSDPHPLVINLPLREVADNPGGLLPSERLPMRPTGDLIKELKKEAKGAVVVQLVVAFPDETKMVASDDPRALETLKALVECDGEPVGFIRIEEKEGELCLKYRLLEEHESDVRWKRVLTELARQIQYSD